MNTDNLNKAIKAIELLGGPTSAATKLSKHFPEKKDLTMATVWNWKKRGVPPEYCIPIEKELNRKILRHELRPDIYPPEEYEGLAQI